MTLGSDTFRDSQSPSYALVADDAMTGGAVLALGLLLTLGAQVFLGEWADRDTKTLQDDFGFIHRRPRHAALLSSSIDVYQSAI